MMPLLGQTRGEASRKFDGSMTDALPDTFVEMIPPRLLVTGLSFWKAIFVCLSKFSTFSGRGSRSEYWQFFLASWLTLNLAIYSDVFIFYNSAGSVRFILSGYVVIILATPLLAAAWRRMHDVGMSGWNTVLPQFVAVILLISPLLINWIFSDVVRQNWSLLMVARARLANANNPEILYSLIVVSVLIYLLPLYWLTRTSQPGPNRYGPNPNEVPS